MRAWCGNRLYWCLAGLCISAPSSVMTWGGHARSHTGTFTTMVWTADCNDGPRQRSRPTSSRPSWA
eukprot:5420756-Pyramimonas_sp.AAC.1